MAQDARRCGLVVSSRLSEILGERFGFPGRKPPVLMLPIQACSVSLHPGNTQRGILQVSAHGLRDGTFLVATYLKEIHWFCVFPV